MKLTALMIAKVDGPDSEPVFFGSAVDVMNFGYFQRGQALTERTNRCTQPSPATVCKIIPVRCTDSPPSFIFV
eukprot:gene3852-13914_t